MLASRLGSSASAIRIMTTSGLLTALSVAALPGTAHAQFSGIQQQGSAIASSTVVDRSPQGMYTQPYSNTATLQNLASGMQTIGTAGVSYASASLTTLVGPSLIGLNGYAQATNGTRNFYGTNGVINHITDISSGSSASATIRFTLDQASGISITDSVANGANFSTLLLQSFDAQGAVAQTISGSAVLGLTFLNAGNYGLQVMGKGSASGTSWGLNIRASSVPEPSAPALWALGGLMLLSTTRRR
ncbi:MAG: hypothetical protein RI907_120 [Pseudomonadota bacterium]|jgi:hypothetical protein